MRLFIASCLIRHNDAASKATSPKSAYFWEDGTVEVYPLMLRITVVKETNIMNVKISKKVWFDSPLLQLFAKSLNSTHTMLPCASKLANGESYANVVG